MPGGLVEGRALELVTFYALGPEGDSARVSQETGDWVGMEANLGGTVSSSDT